MRVLIAIGGAVGAVGRVAVDQALAAAAFPVATLAVNLTGVFALAWLVTASHDPRLRAALGTGVLGAWTTFSALAVQLDPGAAGSPGAAVAVAYAAATLAGGAVALLLGRRLGTAHRGVTA